MLLTRIKPMAATVCLWVATGLAGVAATGGNSETAASRSLPGSEGGGPSLRAAAGRPPGEFHVTFEQNGVGVHARFDGERWSGVQAITPAAPFRSGVHLAVDAGGAVHFVWGESRQGGVFYRSLVEGRLSPIETLEPATGWGEGDVAIDREGRVLVALTRPSEGLAVYQREAEGKSSFVEFPRDDPSAARWSPTLAVTESGRVFVAARKKPGDHPTVWHVRTASGGWSAEQVVPGNKKEPFGIAIGESFAVAAVGEPTFFRIAPGHDDSHATLTAALPLQAELKRGQHLGLARTRRGTLYLAHSTQSGGRADDRTLRPGQYYLYSISCDDGRTWRANLRPDDGEEGQGYGAIAANGDEVLLVWPDLRGGPYLRYRLLRDNGAE